MNTRKKVNPATRKNRPARPSKSNWWKALTPEKITLWLNIIGFVSSLLFYIRMASTKVRPEPLPVVPSALYDSSLRIQTELQVRLKDIRLMQDSLLRSLNTYKSRYQTDQVNIRQIRQNLKQTLKGDWQQLSRTQQDAYLYSVFHPLRPPNTP